MLLSEKSCLGVRAHGFNMYRDLVDVDFPEGISQNHIVSDNDDMNSQLFETIFAVDPLTHLPSGDIALHLSTQVDPSVKRFIELNLHSPVSIDSDSSGNFKDLSDDDIAMFTRNNIESSADYARRVHSLLLSDLEKNDK